MSGFLIFDKKDDEGNTVAVDLGNLYTTGKDGEKLFKVYKIPPTDKLRVIGRHELPEQEWPEDSADNDGCFKVVLLLLVVGAAAVMGLVPRSAYAQQWQPTTWPPAAAPGCEIYTPMPAGTPDLCGGIAELQVSVAAYDYATLNGADDSHATQYGQSMARQWNRQAGRYDNEAWMWQPAPQNQAQWDQRRRQGGR